MFDEWHTCKGTCRKCIYTWANWMTNLIERRTMWKRKVSTNNLLLLLELLFSYYVRSCYQWDNKATLDNLPQLSKEQIADHSHRMSLYFHAFERCSSRTILTNYPSSLLSSQSVFHSTSKGSNLLSNPYCCGTSEIHSSITWCKPTPIPHFLAMTPLRIVDEIFYAH